MLETSVENRIGEIRMARPPVNALNLELVEALLAAVKELSRSDAQVIIISGNDGVFSAGLDVPELMQASRNGVTVFWDRFFKLTQVLLSSPVPIIAALTGHAPAGGAVLAIHCDYRVAARGDYKLGLNEVQVGLVVPDGILRVLRALVGARQSALMATTGAMLAPEQALAVGLVDELADLAEVRSAARRQAELLQALPPVAMNTTRLNAKAALLEQPVSKDHIREMTDYWFSAETQATLRALVASLGK